VKHATIRKAFESYLKRRELKLTAQRSRIFERAFATHEHFTAEGLLRWLLDEEGPRVSRATIYRTLQLLVEGGFLTSLDTGDGELRYEHVLGHQHHDHLVCQECGRIEEFHDERIERLQEEVCERRGFTMTSHDLRLFGYCRGCRSKAPDKGATGVRTGKG
jgi:Fur family ferric uptake transcriptional regulator